MSEKQKQSANALSVKNEGILDSLPTYAATFLFGALVILVSSNLLVRTLGLDIEYLFWAIPLSRYSLIVMTYIGLAVAMRNNETIKIDLLQRLLKDRWPRLYHLNIFIIVMLVASFALLTLYGSAMSAVGGWGSTTDMPFISVGMIHLGIAIGMVFITIYISYDVIQYGLMVFKRLTNIDVPFNRSTIMNQEEIDNAEPDEQELSDIRDAVGLEDEN